MVPGDRFSDGLVIEGRPVSEHVLDARLEHAESRGVEALVTACRTTSEHIYHNRPSFTPAFRRTLDDGIRRTIFVASLAQDPREIICTYSQPLVDDYTKAS